jgi:hypothetical protein
LPFGTSSPHALCARPPLRGHTKTRVTSHQTTESTDDYDESRTGWDEVPEVSLLARIRSPTMRTGPSSSEAEPPHNARLLWDPPLLLRLALLGICAVVRWVRPAIASPHWARWGPFAGARFQNRLPPEGSGARVQVMITVAYPYPLARRDMPRQQAGADCGLARTRRS